MILLNKFCKRVLIMKIALCTEIMYPVFGVERRVFEMAKRLPKHGYEVDLYTSTPPSDMEGSGLNVIQVSDSTIKNPPKRNYFNCVAFWLNLFRKLSASKCDIIDANGHMSLLPCSLAAKMRNRASIATIHDMYIGEWRGMYSGIMALPGAQFEFFSAKMHFDKFLCVNTTVRRKLISIAGIDAGAIRVLQSGIDTRFIDKIKSGRKKQRILYVNRLAPQKSADTLIRAYARLDKETRDEYELCVVGKGRERENLEALAKSLGVGVNFTGFVKSDADVMKMMKESEIFVLSSRRESLGLSVLEAMYSRCAVVSTACDGPRDYIAHGRNGLLTEIGSPESMTHALTRAIEDGKLRKRMQASARQTAKGYDWDIVVKRIAAVYGEML